MEMFNEFNLLMVNYHLTSLTDWVSDGDTRAVIGISMIAVTMFGILVNVIVILKQQLVASWFAFKKWKHKRAVKERIEELMAVQAKE